MINTIIIILILISAILGTPLFVVMAMSGLVAFFLSDINLSAVAIEIYKISSQSTILTIPLFTLAGFVMAKSKSPQRLLALSQAFLSWLPGGSAIVSLIVCAFFTAFTGASGVTIIALGGLIYPLLLQENYDEKFSLGLVTTSGSLGLLFAPSLPIILYGLVAKVDIDQLFKAGILPGLFLIFILSSYSIFKSYKFSKTAKFSKNATTHNQDNFKQLKREKFCLKIAVKAVKKSFFEILIPFGVLIGIYGGVVTTTEAAALTATYVIIMECFIYKDIHFFKDLPAIIIESMSLVGGILLILCCALGFTNYLVDEEIPLMILTFMKTLIHNQYSFLLFLNLFLLVVGSLMDIFSAIIVVVPLIVPIAHEFGINPVHLAIIFLTNLEIGYLTPPVGINLFISSFRFKKPISELYVASFPFLILLVFALLVITYIPWLSLALL